MPDIFTKEEEVVINQNQNTNIEISYAELSKIVRENYDLKEVIQSYIDLDERISPWFCPKCNQQDFEIMRNAKNGRLEYWCCFNCYNSAYDVIEFVAWIEGIDHHDAILKLATQAGLLK